MLNQIRQAAGKMVLHQFLGPCVNGILHHVAVLLGHYAVIGEIPDDVALVAEHHARGLHCHCLGIFLRISGGKIIQTFSHPVDVDPYFFPEDREQLLLQLLRNLG